MKKRPSKLTILALALTLLCGITIGANAADTLQEIKAYLDAGITITLDGEAQTFTDAKGNRVYPISYNGTTYLPVRAVAGLVGLDVNWDQATKTVALGKTTGVDLIDTYKNYYHESSPDNWSGQHQTADGESMDISGITCSHWLELYTGTWLFSDNTNTKISFNLEGKYENVTFQYYASKDVTLKVLGDNDSVLFEVEIPGGQVAQTVTVPLFKTNQITFYTEQLGDIRGSHAYIFDAKLS